MNSPVFAQNNFSSLPLHPMILLQGLHFTFSLLRDHISVWSTKQKGSKSKSSSQTKQRRWWSVTLNIKASFPTVLNSSCGHQSKMIPASLGDNLQQLALDTWSDLILFLPPDFFSLYQCFWSWRRLSPSYIPMTVQCHSLCFKRSTMYSQNKTETSDLSWIFEAWTSLFLTRNFRW